MHPVIAKLGVARRRELSANPYFAALSESPGSSCLTLC